MSQRRFEYLESLLLSSSDGDSDMDAENGGGDNILNDESAVDELPLVSSSIWLNNKAIVEQVVNPSLPIAPDGK